MRPRSLAVCIALLLLATTASAQDLSAFESILVPVLSEGVVFGAHGASFQTTLTAISAGPVAYYPAPGAGGPAVGTLPMQPDTVPVFSYAPVSAGRILYVERGAASRISFGYQLHSTGPDAMFHSVTLPLLRERDLRTGTSWFHGLAFEPIIVSSPIRLLGYASRNRVRIYDGDFSGRLSMTVRLLGTGPRSAFVYGEYTVDVNRREFDDPTYPYFGEVAIPDTCVRVPSNVFCNGVGFTVELTPNDPGIRYWAVGTKTRNATSETVVVTPQ
jgi:hypothetical protein